MIQKVYDILSGIGVPVQYILRPDISTAKTGISYHFFNEGYELYADGKGEEFGGVLQVDVFSTIDYSSTVQQVRELLEAAKFRLADMRDGDDGFEDSMRYYHKILIFNYSKREVLGNGS
jgi:hypothetical protein